MNDRVCLLRRDGRPTMVVVRIGRVEDWLISAAFARLLADDLRYAANQAAEENLAAGFAVPSALTDEEKR